MLQQATVITINSDVIQIKSPYKELLLSYSDLTTINGVTKPVTIDETTILINALKNGVKMFIAAATQAITTGGTAQTPFAASNVGRYISIVNVDPTAILWVNPTGTAAANTSGSIPILPYSAFAPNYPITNAISVVGATTGQKFTALAS